jgi:peroxiredoxin
MPSIQRLADALRDRPFAVIGVNVGEGELRARAVVQQLGIRFPVLIDKDSAAFQRWGATVLPTTYVLDGEGLTRYVELGPLEWDSVELIDLLNRISTRESKGACD